MLFAIAFFAGCDSDWQQASTRCGVTGTLTLDGQAISDAKVVFVPQRCRTGDQETTIASGKTNDEGEFVLKVDSREEKQIGHGRYLVVVSKVTDSRELFHESYNQESVLYVEVDSQDAVQRPKLELKSTGTL